MKKVLMAACCAAMLFTFAGCEKVTSYKPGTYEATVIDPYNNEGNEASAKIVIGEDGKIESVFLDTTYTVNGEKTTKKTLKDDYNMKTYNPSAAGEWYEQVEKLEAAIVENNGVDFITLIESDDEAKNGTTDTVSGCTIKVDALKEAASKALEKAK